MMELEAMEAVRMPDALDMLVSRDRCGCPRAARPPVRRFHRRSADFLCRRRTV